MVKRLPGKYKTLGFGPQLQGSWVVVCVCVCVGVLKSFRPVSL